MLQSALQHLSDSLLLLLLLLLQLCASGIFHLTAVSQMVAVVS